MTSGHPLLDRAQTSNARTLLETTGEVFRVFDQQDSGCVSYGVLIGAERWFVKTATTAAAAGSLQRAIAVHEAVRHPAVLAPVHVVREGPDARPMLVYPWLDGEVLHHATVGPDGTPTSASRSEPGQPMARFRALPLDVVRHAVDVVLDAHRTIDEAGLVAVDLYDGCFLYDFATDRLRLIDLDEYRPGPFTTTARLPGSTRFMAPEELAAGCRVDRRTTVFRLGRVARLLLDAGDEERAWRGTEAELAVIEHATRPDPDDRFPTVDALVHAWTSAR
ncbi:MAG: serine/threonine protein kinase [Angustibacter sp.]